MGILSVSFNRSSYVNCNHLILSSPRLEKHVKYPTPSLSHDLHNQTLLLQLQRAPILLGKNVFNEIHNTISVERKYSALWMRMGAGTSTSRS